MLASKSFGKSSGGAAGFKSAPGKPPEEQIKVSLLPHLLISLPHLFHFLHTVSITLSHHLLVSLYLSTIASIGSSSRFG